MCRYLSFDNNIRNQFAVWPVAFVNVTVEKKKNIKKEKIQMSFVNAVFG